jgi:hypothetical protein
VQKDSAGLYTYSICFHLNAVSSKLISNETIEAAPGDSAKIDVELKGLRLEPVVQGYVNSMNFKSRENKGQLTDDNGRLTLTLFPGRYKIEFQAIGRTPYSIDSLSLLKGQKQKIVISLGEPSGFRTIEIKTTKRMNKKELEKKRLRFDEPEPKESR